MSAPAILLNDAQRRAVTDGDGPALILAGAGSGKTRVIIERLAYLVREKGVDPRQLLALTFTNKAAGEMRERAAARLDSERFPAWIGTFHSFGLYLLRRHMDAFGRKASFTIFDDQDQISLVKRLIKDLPAGQGEVTPRTALEWIGAFKQRLETPTAESHDGSPEYETYLSLWSRYHEALHRANAVDFDDLLVLPARLLTEHAAIRARWHSRFRYIHIDEYQDTNRAQYIIAKTLGEGARNLFVVGDEDQSIYSWRGADIRNILAFEKDFPDAKTIRLEQNYRSTAPILAAANAVVANNTQRLGKTLWTAEKNGSPVLYHEASDGEDEARFVVDQIAKRGWHPNDTAVLYRTNGQARALEEAFRMAGMLYVVVGGVQFYARKEVKDILAYLRVLANPADDVSVRRIINTPTRGIGATTMEQLEDLARLKRIPLLEAIREAEHDETLSGRARKALTEFLHLIDGLGLSAMTDSLVTVVETLLAQTKYREYVAQSDEKDFRARLEIVDEFLSSCAVYSAKQGGTLLDYLQDMALVSDVDSYDTKGHAVTLMTCHSAKGLEFPNVFLVGLEEGLLPHAGAAFGDGDVEEERRLCYVAMTRARRHLVLTSARERTVYGERRACEPSRFLGEIPANFLAPALEKAPVKKAEIVARPKAEPADAAEYKTGARVWHAQFGKGTVMFTKGSGAKLRAHIRFESGRAREFMVSAAPLQIVKGDRR